MVTGAEGWWEDEKGSEYPSACLGPPISLASRSGGRPLEGAHARPPFSMHRNEAHHSARGSTVRAAMHELLMHVAEWRNRMEKSTLLI